MSKPKEPIDINQTIQLLGGIAAAQAILNNAIAGAEHWNNHHCCYERTENNFVHAYQTDIQEWRQVLPSTIDRGLPIFSLEFIRHALADANTEVVYTREHMAEVCEEARAAFAVLHTLILHALESVHKDQKNLIEIGVNFGMETQMHLVMAALRLTDANMREFYSLVEFYGEGSTHG